MFDTMTWTKIVGAFCGMALLFLLGGFVGELIYHGGGGHGDDHAQAYTIEVADSGEGGGEGEEAVPFAELYAAADAGAGERVWRQCSACHKLDGSNAVGPYLNGVVDRAIASVAGYNYSGALAAVAEQWTPENLSAFIEAPADWAPGTAMSYRGLADAEDRANLIAYLATTN